MVSLVVLQQQDRSLHNPPIDLAGQRFYNWFSYPWGFLTAVSEGVSVLGSSGVGKSDNPRLVGRPRWFTESRFPLTGPCLWERWLAPETLLGLRFGPKTRYGMVDVDRTSPYHPANDEGQFKNLLGALEDIGLCRSLIVTSSQSGGLHVYYFLPQTVPTFNLACAMHYAIESAGLKVKGGWCELFPNRKTYGVEEKTSYNGHRLPLQQGSFILDDDYNPISNDINHFLDLADLCARGQDCATLTTSMTQARECHRKWQSGQPKSLKQKTWKKDLETKIGAGFTGHGQTNNLLGWIAEYGRVFLCITDAEKLFDYVHKTVTNLPGYRKYCRHIADIVKRSWDWAKKAMQSRYPWNQKPAKPLATERYWKDESVNEHNQDVKQDAQYRLAKVMAVLQEREQLPDTLTARRNAIVATSKELFGVGFSLATLNKPEYRKVWARGCVSSLPEQDTAISATLENTEVETLKPSQEGNVHTPYSNEGYTSVACPLPFKAKGEESDRDSSQGGESERGDAGQLPSSPFHITPPPPGVKNPFRHIRESLQRGRHALRLAKIQEFMSPPGSLLDECDEDPNLE